jgi:hypothetical protein
MTPGHDLQFPDFTLGAYSKLLDALLAVRELSPLSNWFNGSPRTRPHLLLRHDVDFLPSLALPMARIEHQRGVRSTWFIGIHLSYNALGPSQALAIRELVSLDHEIGFHYVAAVYDGLDPAARRDRLRADAAQLESVAGNSIDSIAMHNPSSSVAPDPFLADEEFRNAYNPDLMADARYTSDSGRAWRPEGLATCFDSDIPLAYLLIHPEVWTDEATPCWRDFLDHLQTRLARGSFPERSDVAALWAQHPARTAHDRRVAQAAVNDPAPADSPSPSQLMTSPTDPLTN